MAPRFSRGKGQQEPLRPCRPDSQLLLTSPPNAPTLPTLYLPELARSPAAAAAATAVTTKDPPSCNPILSAFLFLLQQVRTGCPSRGYGGRRVQRVTPPFLHALPWSAVLSGVVERVLRDSFLDWWREGSCGFGFVRFVGAAPGV
ncbi:unnamed protein product [Rangifer tarandus platyrhynchus]|uniref:Uncharacterized protein n=1 Tax=Rangifer tarandus platyrhynchus TaxID=3082113 RepID=A0AC59ZTY3_RANTA